MAFDLDETIPAGYFRAAFAVEDDDLRSYLDAPSAISLRKWRLIARRDKYLGLHRTRSIPLSDPEEMEVDTFLAAFAMTRVQLDELVGSGVLETRGSSLSMSSIRRFTELLMTKRLVVWTAPDLDLFTAHRLDRIAEPLLAVALDGIRLVPTSRPTRSRVGGTPDLDDRSWPLHQGAPLAFVAQLDLAEMAEYAASTDLPVEGLLSFFYTPDWNAPGFDPASRTGWQVVWIKPGTVTQQVPLPATMSGLGRFRPVNLDFKRSATLPSPRSNVLGDLDLDEHELERYDDLWWEVAGNEPHHWIGGYADIIQSDDIFQTCQLAANGLYAGDRVAYESEQGRALLASATDWRLLLQIWNDDEAAMMWADSGCLYFCIRRQDLRQQQFDRVWTVMESL